MLGFLSFEVIGAVLLAVTAGLIARRLMQGRSIIYPYRIRGSAPSKGMKVYVDIDGTLIHEELGPQFGMPAEGLGEFLKALRPYDVHWLTTHCMDGDPSRAQALIKQHVPEELHPDVDRIKPTAWETHKAEAIDFTGEFLWFENDPFPEDLITLSEHDAIPSLVKVDLWRNPEQLRDIVRDTLRR